MGIGFVNPRTVRPVSGVCANSCSRPVPPARGTAGRADVRLATFDVRRGTCDVRRADVRRADVRRADARRADARRAAPPDFLATVFRLAWRARFTAVFGRTLPLGRFVPAVLRFPPRLLATAARAAPAFRLEGVRFCPRLFRLFFLAMALFD